MKRIYALLLVLMLCLSLAACGSKDNAADEEAATNNAATTEVSFKEATEKGPVVWYTSEALDGRNTVIDGVYYFKDGKVTAYIPRLFGRSYSGQLGTLEDYYSLSDEDAVALAKERYEAFYTEYIDLEKREASFFEDNEGSLENAAQWEDQKAAYDVAIEELKSAKTIDRSPVSSDCVMLLDDSGNNVTLEASRFQHQIETTWSGQLSTYGGGADLYEVNPPYEVTTFLAANSPIEPFEVYDSCFGGYSGNVEEERVGEVAKTSTLFMLTKCDAGTSFVLDPPNTEGVEVLN